MISTAYVPPPPHPQEKERLEALHALRVLDTKPEERYDRITRLASQVFDVPIAYVSLVDKDRQWFKSSHGLNVCETSRDISFCGYTILDDKMLVLPDVTQNPRFAGHPMVTGEPHIRFYAGQPLYSRNKLPVGTLCLVDNKAREFGEGKQIMFREMAGMVERELNLVDTIEAQEKLIHAQVELLAHQNRMRRELASGARYVHSLLPKPLRDERIEIDWCFHPSEHLGGDAFHYYWLNPDTLVFFLLDVAGHGIESALLSVSVLDTLRNRSLVDVDFSSPRHVLHGLNSLYNMSEHHNMYFTLWYGVCNTSAGSLQYATGGHPQAILWRKSPDPKLELLGEPGHLVGAFRDMVYTNCSLLLLPGDRLHIFSDGLYEALDDTGNRWSVADLGHFLSAQKENLSARDIVHQVQKARNLKKFQDDVSLLEVRFK